MNTAHRVPKLSETLFASGIAFACRPDAQVVADGPFGLFVEDTRVLSTYRSTIGGHAWKLLGRSRSGSQRIDWMFQNPALQQSALQHPSGVVPEGTILLYLARSLDRRLVDEYRIQSYATAPTRARLTLQIDSDFADIFEVKEQSIPPRLNVTRTVDASGLRLSYETAHFQRAVRVHIDASAKPSYAGALVVFELELSPNRPWCGRFEFDIEADHEPIARSASRPSAPAVPRATIQIDADPLLAEPFRQGVDDLRSLCISLDEDPPYVAAGVPWFVALFGRDTLVTALMAGVQGSSSARGALAALGARQARSFDSFRDAEPGKLPHEVRRGELARLHLIPHDTYYGTHDAPSLFCLALWNAWRFTGDRALLDAHMDTARAALAWCDALGDRDGDGFQEYGTRSSQGYFNQGWKDAADAILHEDGELPPLPIGTVELQGYWFAARWAMADLEDECGRPLDAKELRRKARDLRRAVEERFFMPEQGFYALALDGTKRLVRSIASNPLHLLWCGLPSAERARAIAARAFEPDMFSGWGIRTISSLHPSYNPLSYQLGSVWPHDNAIAAAGLARYGLRDHAWRAMRAILDAANAFEMARLPEVYTGLDREMGLPVPYAQANSPQAWAAAAPILFAQIALGLVPDLPRKRCFLDPHLPPWLPRLELNGIELGTSKLDVTLSRRNERTLVEKCSAGSSIELVRGVPPAPLWGAPMPEDA